MEASLATLDQTQIDLLKEECLVIDNNDKHTNNASKKDCHLMENIRKGLLHRAFSVFLFNEEGKLLLQQRASEKITFPGHWTNTCCSHPLNRPLEIIETEALGIRNAAVRKLDHELGIQSNEVSLGIHSSATFSSPTSTPVPVDSLTYLTRIQYESENVPYDGIWGESEIDYILFATRRSVSLDRINANEVKAVRYVDEAELAELMKTEGVLITPWFRLIAEHFLSGWWRHLDNLKDQQQHDCIYRMKPDCPPVKDFLKSKT